MLERRKHARRRVCLEATVTGDLTGEPRNGQIRSLSMGGAELVMPGGSVPSAEVALAFARETDRVREGSVVWRRMNRFGVAFADGSRPTDGARPGPLSSLLRAVR